MESNTLNKPRSTSQIMRIQGGPSTRQAYRFMSGNSMRFYNPGTWATNAITCFTLDSKAGDMPDQWGGCTQHSYTGGGASYTKPVTRNLSY